MSTPITSSGIKTGYYFVVTDSNNGAGVTSVSGNTTVGIGTSFIDNIYKVALKTSQVMRTDSKQPL